MRRSFEGRMTTCTVMAGLLVLLVAMQARAEEEETKGGRRPKLTDETIRSEERVYRKAPEGELSLHLYYPTDWKAGDARPAIVFFFGGGWTSGSYQQFESHAEYFASRGLVGIAADYRIKNKHHTTPDKSVEDAKSAMRWIRSHAGELGIDPNKIIAAGGSAGGHLAAATALVDDFNAEGDDTSVSCRPNALVLFNPVVDLTRLPNRRLAEGQDETIKKKLSPIFYISDAMPPAILFFGTEDKFFPPAEEFVAKAEGGRGKGEGKASEKSGENVRVELYVAPGKAHGFFNRSPWTEVTAAKADEFLASLGYLQGPPTVKVPTDAPKLERR